MNGWDESASAWIKDMGENGDNGRQFILDPALKILIEGRGFKNALDIGCGEGRMCRYLETQGIETIGIDPTTKLLAHARELDNKGQYIEAYAENLPFKDNQFDLVLSCMSLIDIPDYKNAIKEMVRVLKPMGSLLVANLSPMNTAGAGLGWQFDENRKTTHYAIDNYMKERCAWEEWRGIKILNHHRPLSAYMKCFLESGLTLKHFEEPTPTGGKPEWIEHYKRMPWFVIMEWGKA